MPIHARPLRHVVFVAALLALPINGSASGEILRVNVDNAPIKRTENGVDRIVASATRGTKLWAFRFDNERKFARVVDPTSGEEGWIWLQHATVTQLPLQQKRDWESAVRLFRESGQTLAFIDPSYAEQNVLQALGLVEDASRRLNSGVDFNKVTSELKRSRRLAFAILSLDRARRMRGGRYRSVLEGLTAGEIASNLEAHDEAELIYEAMASTFSGEERRWSRLLQGIALSEQKRFDEANQFFKEIRRDVSTQEFSAVLAMAEAESLIDERKFTEAERRLRPAHMSLEINSKNLALIRMVLAEACNRQGKVAEAESLLKRAHEASDNQLITHALALLYSEHNRNLNDAERLSRKALEAEPQNPEFLYGLGWALLRQGKLAAAKEALTQATYFSTVASAEIYEHLGDCHEALGESPEAAQSWTTALAIAQAEPVPDPELVARLQKKAGNSSADGVMPVYVIRKDQPEEFSVDVEQVDFEQYRLATLLEAAKKIDAASEAYLVEVVVGNASVRVDGNVVTRLPHGLKLYAVKIDEPNNRALVKVPDKDIRGWISLSSIRPRDYSQRQLQLIEKADRQSQKAYEQYEQGNLGEAETTARTTYESLRKELGESDIATAAALSAYGDLLTKCHGSVKSVPVLLQASNTLRSAVGENHIMTAGALRSLGTAYSFSDDDFAKSIPLMATVLKIVVATGEESIREQLSVMTFMGNAAVVVGDLVTAREYLEHARTKAEASFGRNHRATFEVWNAISTLEFGTDQAESAKATAFEIAKAIFPENHRDRLLSQLRYGKLLTDRNRLADGRAMMEQAAAGLTANFGELDDASIEADREIADFRFNLGEVDVGIEMMTSVANRTAKVYGPDHMATLQAKGDVATMLRVAGRDIKALEMLEALLKSSSAKGEDFGTTYSLQHAIGLNLLALGRIDEAESALQRSSRLAEHEIAADDPLWAMQWHALTRSAMMRGDLTEAKRRLDRVRHFTQDATLGVQDTSVAERAGEISAAEGKIGEAAASFDEVAKEIFATISDDLSALSEKEQLSYLRNYVDIQSSIFSLTLETPGDAEIATQTAEWHVNLKANSHELLTRQMRALRDSGEHAGKLQELFALRQKLAREGVRDVPAYGKQAHDRRIRELTEQEARMARELSAVTADSDSTREWIELAELREAVPRNAHLVTFIRIRPANYRYTSYANRYGNDRYLAWVIPPKGPGDVVSIDLGPAEEIDTTITSAHEAIHNAETLGQINSEGEVAVSESTNKVLQELSGRVLKPILAVTGATSELILSPDGQLWTVPWAALPIAEDTMLIEGCRVRMVVAGRDLLKSNADGNSSINTSPPVVFADPAFDDSLDRANIAASNEVGRRLRNSGLRFSASFNSTQPLPGTAAEAAAIKGSLATFAGSEPRIFLQESATESAAKSLRHPKCVVMSTHGFFFDAPEDHSASTTISKDTRIYQNPLLRCGLLLSGCNHAATSSNDTDDGILTGLEIVNTDLRGTELVVLSACETGLGDVRDGEGVAGLRQAFQLAGAESVVASLWQVDDRSTALLMDAFFKNLAKGMSKAEALRQAQLARIKKRRERNGAAHPFFWAAFTLTGLDSTGETLPEMKVNIAEVEGNSLNAGSLQASPMPRPSETPPAMTDNNDSSGAAKETSTGTLVVKNISKLFTVRVRVENEGESSNWKALLPGTETEFKTSKLPATLGYYRAGNSVLIRGENAVVEMDRIDAAWKPNISYGDPSPNVANKDSSMEVEPRSYTLDEAELKLKLAFNDLELGRDYETVVRKTANDQPLAKALLKVAATHSARRTKTAPNQLQELHFLGDIAMLMEDYDTAEQCFRRGLYICPKADEYRMFQRIAIAMYKRGEIEQAAEKFRWAIIKARESNLQPELLKNLILSTYSPFVRDGHFDLALEFNRQAQDVTSGDTKNQVRLDEATILFNQTKYQKARSLLDQLISDIGGGSSLDVDAQILLSQTELKLERYKHSIAIARDLLANRSLKPQQVESLHFLLSTGLDKSGDEAGAERMLRELIVRRPDNAAACNQLGYFLADRNRSLNEAERLTRKATRAEPGNPAFLDSLGWVAFRQGNLAFAKESLEKAVRVSVVPDPEILEHLGDVCEALGKTKEAARHWQTAVNRVNSHPAPDQEIRDRLVEKLRVPTTAERKSERHMSTTVPKAKDGHSVLVRNQSPLSVQLRLVKGFRFIEDFTVPAESEETISVPAAHVLKIFDAARGGWIRSKSAREIIVEAGGGLTKTTLPAEQVAALGLSRAVIIRNKSNKPVDFSLVKGAQTTRKIEVQAAGLRTIEVPKDCGLRLFEPTENRWAQIEPGVGIVIHDSWGTGQVIRLIIDDNSTLKSE